MAKRSAFPFPPGSRVKFTINNLGASLRTELSRVTEETYGTDDAGVVAFAHPNRKACPDWVYVEVDSKNEPGAKRYVGVNPHMVEAAS